MLFARSAKSKVLALLGTATLSVALGTLSSTSPGMAQPVRSAPAWGGVPSLAFNYTGGGPESKLKQIEAAAGSESKATFAITYTDFSSSGPSKFTIEQMPPYQLFGTSSGVVIYNGKKTYYCSTGSSGNTCVAYGSVNASPAAAFINIYSASTYVGIMQGWQGLLAARIAGVHISFSNAHFAGQASECVSWSYQGSSAKYCVTDKGILAYVGGSQKGSNSGFELTRYSSRVSRSAFDLPRGAKIMAMP